MKKYIMNFLCFFIAAAIVASTSFFDMSSAYSVNTITKIESVNGDTGDTASEARKYANLDSLKAFDETFDVKGFNKGIFKNNSKYFAGKAVYAADEDMKIVFFDNSSSGNAYVDQGSVLDLDTSKFTLAVSRVYKADSMDAPFAEGTTMEFSVVGAGNNVIEIENDTNLNDNSAVIKRVGPGRATVSVTIKENGTVRYATITIHVAFEIIQTDAEWEETGLSGYSDKVLFLDQRNYPLDTDYYQLDILYMDSTAVTTDTIVAVDDKEYNDSVVAYSNGKLYVKGAGYTRVTLSTTGQNADTASFYVLVAPVGSVNPENNDQTSTSYNPLTMFTQTVDLGTVYTSNFTIYSNAKKATNLSWSVYVVDKNGGLKEISKNDTSRLTYSISENSGVLNFTGVTAGTYKIIGEANTGFNEKETRNRVVYDVAVMLSLSDTTIYMNVGDTYDVLGNSNIPVDAWTKLFSFSYDGNSTLYAEINKNTGIITAKSVGTSKITIKYTGGSQSSLYPPSISTTISDVVYTVHVIDYLSINNSLLASDGSAEFTMYAGGEYPIYAACTNRDYDIYWESLDTSIAEVSDNGYGSVLVKAKKRGVVTIRAYQIIDGVEKNAYAKVTVKNTATAITLSPTKAEIEIGDYKTIIAQFTGDSTELTWVSSDPTIFSFVDNINTGTSATICALKPGTAILTAINPNNIVCGYCEVTVFQEVTGITLSEYTLQLPESTGTYQLYAYLSPNNASDSSVLWSSSKPTVVTVDSNGKLTIVGDGEATIIAQSVLNPEYYAVCTVTVLQGVTGITLDSHELELYNGEVYRLPYVIEPKNASDDVITISVFDSSVISVTEGSDHTLLVTARNTGSTTFMVMTEDGKYWDLCTVTVKQVATGVTLNYTAVTMNVGEYFDLGVTLTPANATEASLTWQSLDPKVVSVSSTGRLLGVTPGSTTVMVSTQSGKNSFCTVTVLSGASGIQLDDDSIVIDVGEKYTLDVIFTPADASNTEVRWESLDPAVAAVNEAGTVTGIKGGYTVISCTSVDGGYSAFCMVKVEELIQIITVEPTSYILGLGKTVKIEAAISNRDTVSDTELDWYSDDESVATVDKYGVVTGMGYGETIITVEAATGDASATVKIEVVKEVSGIRLSSSYETVVVGEKISVTGIVVPDDATYTEIKYTIVNNERVEDTTYAIIDSNGVVTGIKKGTAWVMASALDNSGQYALCYLNVIDPVSATGISVSDSEISLLPGESKTITTAIKPVSSTDELTWTTNNDTIASVDEYGTIKANTIGQTTIQVMTTSGKTATISVTVLGLSRTYIEMPVYSTYNRIYLDGVTGTVRWEVDDPSICEIANGTITSRKVGMTVVTAKVNGRTLECIVKVTK